MPGPPLTGTGNLTGERLGRRRHQQQQQQQRQRQRQPQRLREQYREGDEVIGSGERPLASSYTVHAARQRRDAAPDAPPPASERHWPVSPHTSATVGFVQSSQDTPSPVHVIPPRSVISRGIESRSPVTQAAPEEQRVPTLRPLIRLPASTEPPIIRNPSVEASGFVPGLPALPSVQRGITQSFSSRETLRLLDHHPDQHHSSLEGVSPAASAAAAQTLLLQLRPKVHQRELATSLERGRTALTTRAIAEPGLLYMAQQNKDERDYASTMLSNWERLAEWALKADLTIPAARLYFERLLMGTSASNPQSIYAPSSTGSHDINSYADYRVSDLSYSLRSQPTYRDEPGVEWADRGGQNEKTKSPRNKVKGRGKVSRLSGGGGGLDTSSTKLLHNTGSPSTTKKNKRSSSSASSELSPRSTRSSTAAVEARSVSPSGPDHYGNRLANLSFADDDLESGSESEPELEPELDPEPEPGNDRSGANSSLIPG